MVSAADLALWSGWASIISLIFTIITLLYARSIKTNIISFRRKQRLNHLIQEIETIPDDAIPLSSASKSKLEALKRNIPINWFSWTSKRGKIAVVLHDHIDKENIVSIKEAINDWRSFSEEI